MRGLVVTAAIFSAAIATTAAPASARVHASCVTAQRRELALQTHLATVQQHITARTAKLADAGTDQTLIARLQARLDREQHRHDRLAARLAALTRRCPS